MVVEVVGGPHAGAVVEVPDPPVVQWGFVFEDEPDIRYILRRGYDGQLLGILADLEDK